MLLRYSALKKNNVDFIYFSAPWVKKGSSSFNSNVSIQSLRGLKRQYNNKFFTKQEFLLYKLVQYYFDRYNDDFNREFSISKKELFNSLFNLLISNYSFLSSKALSNKNLNQFARTLFCLNIFLTEGEYKVFSKLIYVFYALTFISRNFSGSTFLAKLHGAENTSTFHSFRESLSRKDISVQCKPLGLLFKECWD